MRAALSILGLVIAFAVVMFVMKKQVQQLPKPASAASAAAAQPQALPNPQAVGQQVQSALELGAQRASDANP
ncbi:hypothetical protein PFX98_16420 [Paucibacter sediminis]|uniref:Uncharacterized protein n=1 Tax=Paucibacter sediminis TaxID=3019553 RepID=A0AA95SMT1_9BURK|nr:hypothetical protein [Paucibacter sp. S2-9]WIT10490.1 hypothetical protein PFX98_16420 [Paucibacter sp. S2-9]